MVSQSPTALLRSLAARYPELGRILENASWLTGSRVLRLLVSLFVVAMMARYLGPSQYGVLQYALAIVVIVSSAAGLGLRSVVVRNIVRDEDSVGTLLGSALLLRLASGALVSNNIANDHAAQTQPRGAGDDHHDCQGVLQYAVLRGPQVARHHGDHE